MTENESLEKQIAEDLSAVVKEAKIMGCKEVQNFRHIPLENVETVIQALEENQQYHAIGTVEELQDLKEKAEPKKPIRNDLCTCPSCGTHNEVIKKRRNTVIRDTVYCWHCGQAIECQRDIALD